MENNYLDINQPQISQCAELESDSNTFFRAEA